MKRLIMILPLLAATSGCDKAKNIADKASSAVKQQIEKSTGQAAAPDTDADLAKLVQKNAEGAVFRKDLPFPDRIEVLATTKRELICRVYQKSELDRKAEEIKGTRVHAAKLVRSGDHVLHTLEQSSFTPATLNKDEAVQAIADPFRQVAADTKPVGFLLSDKVWRVDEKSGFRAAALAKQLAPVFEGVLEENALSPRPMWFSKKRMKVGDSFTLSGESLCMVVAGNPSGTLKIKLESFEPVHGHPCGVFSVIGNYNRKKFPDFDGVFTDEDVTIQTGKLWLSQVYPIVLREELDTIQTFEAGGQGGLSIRGQGAVKVTVDRAWKTQASD
jgi:hypothetical protein